MLADSAKSYLAAGLCVLPASRAKKRPTIRAWKQYQDRLPTAVEVGAWFANEHDALCLICGGVSGNLECLDFDSAGAAFPDFQSRVEPEIGARLVCEKSPSGGVHCFYRCAEPVSGNRKLAMSERGEVLIETRGEGGLVLCAPSVGYELFQGAIEDMPVLSAAEREVLMSAAASLDRSPKPAPPPRRAAPAAPPPPRAEPRADPALEEYDLLPGEDYDERADIRPLLESYGWRLVHGGANEGWQRPGKTGDQQSATWNGTTFFVFSSNALPFEANRGYGKFAVYATLVHGGDLSAATEALYAEGYGHRSDPTAGVDSSAVVAQAQALVRDFSEPAQQPVLQQPVLPQPPRGVAESPAAPEPAPDPGVESHDDPSCDLWSLYSCPGFVDTLADYTVRTSRYTNRALAFSGALALLSFLCGRRYRTLSHLSSSLYLIALADSATGKESPRQINFRLLRSFGYGGAFGDRFASGEGLEDSLYRSPSMFYQPDEVSFLFASMSDRNFSPTASSIASSILRLYTDGIYAMRVTSRKRPAKGASAEEARARVIENPNLVLFGTATPEKFYSSLSIDGLENGLVGRCFVVPASAARVRNASPSYDEEPPALIRDVFDALQTLGDNTSKKDCSRSVTEDPAATAELDRIDDKFTERVNAALSGSQLDGGDAALWGRAFEKAYKLALLRAVSRDPEEPCIRAEDAAWGEALAEAVVLDLLRQARLHIASDDFMATVNVVRRVLNSHRGRPVPRSVIINAARVRTRILDEVVDYLKEAGELEVGVAKNTRQSVTAYRLVK